MNKTIKNSAIYLTGTVTMGILGLISTMVLTRVLSQQVYAMYGLLTTLVTTVSMFISFGYDSSYMRFYYNNGYKQKQFMLMCLKVPMIIFLAFVIITVEPTKTFITYIFGEKLSTFSVVILIVYVFFSFTHRFLQLTARMEGYAANHVLSSVIGKSGFIAVVLLVSLFRDVSFKWILISFMVCSIAAVLINLFVFIKTVNKTSKSENHVTNMELFSYGFPYMINNVLILVIPLVEKIIFRDLAGWETLSIYTAAAIFQTVILLILNVATNIWNPIVYKYCDDEKRFKPIIHNLGMIASIIVSVCLIGSILLRRWLVLFLDDSYYLVYTIAPTVLYGACLNILSLVYSVGIDIKKKTGYLIIFPIIQVVISVVICYILVPEWKLAGIAIATLVSILVARSCRMYVGLRLYDTGVSELKSFIINLFCTIAALASLFYTTFVNDLIISIGLFLIVVIVVNKEFYMLYMEFLRLIKPSKIKE